MGYSGGKNRLDSGDKGYGFLPHNTINLLTLREKETLNWVPIMYQVIFMYYL